MQNVPDFGKTFLSLNYINIKEHLYPRGNSYGDNKERKMWSSCVTTFCIHLVWWDICTLHRSVLQSTARRNKFTVQLHMRQLHAAVNCEVS